VAVVRIDLHFHLLPGVDDGPADLGDSLRLARAALEEGTRTVVATPHVRSDFVTDVLALPDLVQEVREELARTGVPLNVRCGAELGHDMVGRLAQHELDTVAQGPPDAPWLLVETPFEGIDEGFHAATEELRDRGFGVLLAHPERSADAILDGAAGLRRERALGAGAQINALSLTGGHGPEARRAALGLVAEGLVEVVGSDAHGPTRPPALLDARAALRGAGLNRPSLTESGPRRLLERGIVEPAPLAA
jgi:protein-tyrosine phosphatase